VRSLAERVAKGEMKPEDITEETIGQSLDTKDYPDPDLLIRTGGEERISNYLLWQIAYAELYFTPVFWPDFSKEDIYDAIVEFQNRERRFGKTSAQIQEEEKGKIL
jgi:undecaprenyl diphosphate synthase